MEAYHETANVSPRYGADGLRSRKGMLELCKERGIPHAVPEAFEQLFQAAIKAGHAQDDFAVLNKFMR